MIRMLRAKRLLMVLALATLFARCAAAQGSNDNVVLITLDALRADRLRCEGYDASGRTLPERARRLAVVELEVLFPEGRFTAGHGQSAVRRGRGPKPRW